MSLLAYQSASTFEALGIVTVITSDTQVVSIGLCYPDSTTAIVLVTTHSIWYSNFSTGAFTNPRIIASSSSSVVFQSAVVDPFTCDIFATISSNNVSSTPVLTVGGTQHFLPLIGVNAFYVVDLQYNRSSGNWSLGWQVSGAPLAIDVAVFASALDSRNQVLLVQFTLESDILLNFTNSANVTVPNPLGSTQLSAVMSIDSRSGSMIAYAIAASDANWVITFNPTTGLFDVTFSTFDLLAQWNPPVNLVNLDQVDSTMEFSSVATSSTPACASTFRATTVCLEELFGSYLRTTHVNSVQYSGKQDREASELCHRLSKCRRCY